jgi:hypothetical protein
MLVLSISLLSLRLIAILLVVPLVHEGQMLGLVQGVRHLAGRLCGFAFAQA